MRTDRYGVSGALLRAALLASSALIAAPSLALAQSASFQGLGFLPGAADSFALGVSSDGLTVVGHSSSHAFRWSGGAMSGLGVLPGMTNSTANAVNADGSVVVGESDTGAAAQEAFRWTGGVMTGLGFLPGTDQSFATAVSSNGSVVVGTSFLFVGPTEQAFIWTPGSGMVGLPFLTGGTFSGANGISADASTVVGFGDAPGIAIEAAVWKVTGTTATAKFGLGLLPGGTQSDALAVNADGSVVVGYGDGTAYPGNEAIRWTVSGTTVLTTTPLGTLPGDTNSYAYAVNADGSVVVGQSNGASDHAFRWTAGTGMQSIQSLLVAAGVNMTGWQLLSARGVSANGSVIVGYGTDPSAQTEGWIARLCDLAGANCPVSGPGGGSGLITVSDQMQSFASVGTVGQTANASLGMNFNTVTSYATQGGTPTSPGSPFSAFTAFGYDSDPTVAGTFGGTAKLNDRGLIAGATVGADNIKTNMSESGSARMNAGTLGAFIAQVPDAGWQWLLGANAIYLTGKISRGYLNGASPVTSTGSTHGEGYGFAARAGYTFANVWRQTSLTPFTSYTFTRVDFAGYTETDGPFPAMMNSFHDIEQVSRVGADARYTFKPGTWTWGTLAWGHRLHAGNGPDVSGTLIGLFPLSAAGGATNKRDWAEATAGVRLAAWKNGAVTASLTASIPAKAATTYAAQLGVSRAF